MRTVRCRVMFIHVYIGNIKKYCYNCICRMNTFESHTEKWFVDIVLLLWWSFFFSPSLFFVFLKLWWVESSSKITKKYIWILLELRWFWQKQKIKISSIWIFPHMLCISFSITWHYHCVRRLHHLYLVFITWVTAIIHFLSSLLRH